MCPLVFVCGAMPAYLHMVVDGNSKLCLLANAGMIIEVLHYEVLIGRAHKSRFRVIYIYVCVCGMSN